MGSEATKMKQPWVTVTVVAALVSVLLSVEAPLAAVMSREKTLAEVRESQATVYFLRPKRVNGAGRTMFVYADRTFLGVLESNSYMFAYLEPGRHLLWLNWAKTTKEIEVEAGTVRYFWIYDHFSEFDADEGRRRIREASWFTTPEDKERKKAKEHIDERYDKALQYAGADTRRTKGPNDRELKVERRIAKWPHVQLAPYSLLYIEDPLITDPKAPERKNQDYVQTAPERLAEFVINDVPEDLFEDVWRGTPSDPVPGSVILRVRVTRYKPALFGKGASAYLSYTAYLIDGDSGEVLGRVVSKRNSALGINELESVVARELSSYLRRCKGSAGQEP